MNTTGCHFECCTVTISHHTQLIAGIISTPFISAIKRMLENSMRLLRVVLRSEDFCSIKNWFSIVAKCHLSQQSATAKKRSVFGTFVACRINKWQLEYVNFVDLYRSQQASMMFVRQKRNELCCFYLGPKFSLLKNRIFILFKIRIFKWTKRRSKIEKKKYSGNYSHFKWCDSQNFAAIIDH